MIHQQALDNLLNNVKLHREYFYDDLANGGYAIVEYDSDGKRCILLSVPTIDEVDMVLAAVRKKQAEIESVVARMRAC